MAHHIIPLLPPHQCYIEPFFGGGSVFWRKEPSPLETINDLDDGVVHFYRVLRDPDLFHEFVRLCHLTPYARVEFETCRAQAVSEPDPVRRAWAWYVCVRQAFGGSTGTGARSGWKYSATLPPPAAPVVMPGAWGYRAGNVGNSAGQRWLSIVEMLPDIHGRLRHVQIEHGDWRRIMDAYAKPGVCAYLDPPYVMATRGRYSKRYAYELADAVNQGGQVWTISAAQQEADVAAHQALVDYLLACPAMVVLSGYRYPAVHDRLEEAGWERIDIAMALNAPRHRVARRAVESVWRNPAAVAAWTAARAQQAMVFDDDDERDERSENNGA